jgi:hypothetical protein
MQKGDILIPEEIVDQPIPLLDGTMSIATGSSSDTTSTSEAETPGTVKDQVLAPPLVAVETISTSLDTKSKAIKGAYTFEQLGALIVGLFQSGVAGQVTISPDGIVAIDKDGNTTFALDGQTGDATFKGTIQASSFIAGAIQVGSANVVIDGANARIIVNDGTNDRILIGFQQSGF